MSRRASGGCLVLLAASCVHCIGDVPYPAAAPAAGSAQLVLHAYDARRRDVDPELLPRRPTLVLAHPHGIAQNEDAVVWLPGPPDEALLADLERAPLSAVQRARQIDCELEWSGSELRVAPRSPLDAGAAYTLAVGAWAKTQRGTSLAQPAGPIVFELRTDAGPEAGARVLRSSPADGASSVGTNLQAAVVVFDGLVEGAAEGVWLEGPDGLALPAAIESGPCSQLAPEHGELFCVRLAPGHRLAPSALYRLVVGGGARDGHGAPVGPWRGSFRTAQSRDLHAPVPLLSSCAIDEQTTPVGCALVDDASIALHMQLDEAAVAILELGAARYAASAPDGRVVLRAAELAPDEEHGLRLTLRDLAGNTLTQQFALRTLPPLATLSIVEVLADPRGPEPQQEFVELLNYGRLSVDLQGFSLADRADELGRAITRSVRVEPQARALLVADGYDPQAPHDPAPPPGALLVRVGPALARGGLRNAGEVLFLRDALGRRVSAAPSVPLPRPGVCTVRTGADMRSGEPDAFDHDAEQSCTPGE